jgi:hypothetical protein
MHVPTQATTRMEPLYVIPVVGFKTAVPVFEQQQTVRSTAQPLRSNRPT